MDYSLIAVMGPTGAGKSTFINLASGSYQKVGTGLKSCTEKVTPTEPFSVQGRVVVLIDTPGFDDTNTSDFDILDEIAEYMAKTYKKKRLLDGILYFHSIADRRMGGIAVRNLRLFESLCGEDPLKSVMVVTNMWGLLPNMELGVARESELREDPLFFGQVLGAGATLVRHTDTTPSSHKIISSLLEQGDKRRRLAIQAELVDEKLRLDETSAAAELLRDFDAMIQNLNRRIEREERAKAGENSVERKEREVVIRKMREKIRQLEERKVRIKKKGSHWTDVVFLRWIKKTFFS
ncbi:P-loop containing nucleoside triphosphate hydrolase protein [Serendipita vermifera]|nr:P-loop containing nucleoside triphosphate hydrolase protein [Serendipita vermifera]